MPGSGKAKRSYAIANVGNYLPRRCGIATFTTDLTEALATELDASPDQVIAVPMNDAEEGYRYPERVKFSVAANVQSDYVRAAEFLNSGNYDVVILQHEFSIFGGEDGSHILHLAQNLRAPLIITLHTLLSCPSEGQKAVLRELAECCHKFTVMSRKAVPLLSEIYGIPPEKVLVIPHGIPDVPLQCPDVGKEQFGFEGRRVLLTFGFLSPNKGIEHMIAAMPEIVRAHPDVIYVVLGETHPHVKRDYGESYRLRLQALAREKGVEDAVWFYNQFVELDSLVNYLLATDIYITPYLQPEQIVSGTLAYSIGAGNAVVSTPYWYAEELLGDAKGVIVPFGDSRVLGKTVNRLLLNDDERKALRTAAYQFSRGMIWKEVARSYLSLVDEALSDTAGKGKRIGTLIQEKSAQQKLLDQVPEVSLEHLCVLTDDTGILQHATYEVPNRQEGYCADDNARALIVACKYYRLRKDETAVRLIKTYLAFLLHALNDAQDRFRNFMSYDRKWFEAFGSDDCHGRSVWGLGYTVHHAPTELIRSAALDLFRHALPAVKQLDSIRAWAFTAAGLWHYLEHLPGDTERRAVLRTVAEHLLERFIEHGTKDWPWPEEVVTYANAALPRALLLAGSTLEQPEMFDMGIKSLRWLLTVQTAPDGHLSLIGNKEWYARAGVKSQFDQQPVEVMGLIGACADAFRMTGDEVWLQEASRSFSWFLGANDVHQEVCDLRTGAGFDGINQVGVNLNQGAEATISYLLSALMIYELAQRGVLKPIEGV